MEITEDKGNFATCFSIINSLPGVGFESSVNVDFKSFPGTPKAPVYFHLFEDLRDAILDVISLDTLSPALDGTPFLLFCVLYLSNLGEIKELFDV